MVSLVYKSLINRAEMNNEKKRKHGINMNRRINISKRKVIFQIEVIQQLYLNLPLLLYQVQKIRSGSGRKTREKLEHGSNIPASSCPKAWEVGGSQRKNPEDFRPEYCFQLPSIFRCILDVSCCTSFIQVNMHQLDLGKKNAKTYSYGFFRLLFTALIFSS